MGAKRNSRPLKAKAEARERYNEAVQARRAAKRAARRAAGTDTRTRITDTTEETE